MIRVSCPRCQKVQDVDGEVGDWITCSKCQHRWVNMGQPVAAEETEPPVPPAGSELPSGRKVPQREDDDADAAEQTHRAPFAGGIASPSNEYPMDTDRLERAAAAKQQAEEVALTKREARLHIEQVVTDASGAQKAQGGEAPAPRSSAASGRAESGASLDLFDEIEKEIESEREQMRTVHDPSFKHPALGSDGEDSHESESPVGADAPAAEEESDPSGNGASGGDPLIGATINGCLVDRKLGEGGMGTVYHAQQLSLDRSVAIKVLAPEYKRDKKFLRRFELEAKSLARINHPHIMHVYDFGEDNALGIYFMIVEFVDGHDLAEILRRRKRLDQVSVLNLLRQALLGLEEAAAKDLVHRDIKPDNLLMTAGEVWKISDFGLAKSADGATQMTNAGIRVGTPAFMSPEQCDGRKLDWRSDVYSLGITAFVALTGKLPFDGDSPFSVMLQHKTDPPPKLVDLTDTVDARVDALIQRMLSKQPEERGESLQVLIEQVDQILKELGSEQAGSQRLRDERKPADVSGVSDPDNQLEALGTGEDDSLPRLPTALLGAGEGIGDETLDSPPGHKRELRPIAVDDDEEDAGPAATAQDEAQAPPVPPEPSGDAAPAPEAGPDLSLQPMQSFGSSPPAPPPSSAPTPPPAPPLASGPPPAAAASSGHPMPAAANASAPSRVDSGRRRSVRSSGSNPASAKSSGHARRFEHERDAQEREGKRGEEVQRLEQDGDERARVGKLRKAMQAWTRAMQRCDNWEHKELLLGKIERARNKLAKRQRRRWLIGLPLALLLVFVAMWQVTPRYFSAMADYELKEVLQIDDEELRKQRLQDLRDRYEQPAEWYTWIFGTFEVPALARVEETLEQLTQRTTHEHTQQRIEERIAELEQRLTEPASVLSEIIADGEELHAQVSPRRQDEVRELIAMAQGAYEQLAERVAAVEQLIASGRIEEGLVKAQAVRLEPHSGEFAERLPWPVRITVRDQDGEVPAKLSVTLEGKELQAGSRQAYRMEDEPVAIEISAPGYLSYRGAISPGGADAPEELTIALRAVRLWRRALSVAKIRAGERGRLAVAGELCWCFASQLVTLIDVHSGEVLAQAPRHAYPPAEGGIREWGSWSRVENGILEIADSEHSVLRLAPEVDDEGRPRLVDQSVDLVAGFLAHRNLPDEDLRVLVRREAEGVFVLGLREGAERWRHGPLGKVQLRPEIYHHANRILLLEDDALHSLEKSGRSTGRLTLLAPRSGKVAWLQEDRVLGVLVGSALTALAFGNVSKSVQQSGQPLELLAEVASGLQGDGAGGVLITAEGQLVAVGYQADAPVELWRRDLPGTLQAPLMLGLGPEHVTVADPDGRVRVYHRGTGELMRSFEHDTEIWDMVMVGDLILVYDRREALSGYRAGSDEQN